jgi:hypothetical protein
MKNRADFVREIAKDMAWFAGLVGAKADKDFTSQAETLLRHFEEAVKRMPKDSLELQEWARLCAPSYWPSSQRYH